MLIDLHTHSNRSDGTDSPADLVRRAAARGIDVLALTDHDTTAGWEEAARTAVEVGVRLVRGLEISTEYAGSSVHLLAYLPDPHHPGLLEELGRILDGRTDRLPQVLAKLRGLGIDLTEDDVRRQAGEAAALGRPHVADAMVVAGVVRDRDEAFARYLGPRGPAYVDRYAADLETCLRLVTDAGGVSVLAHPWARRLEHGALDATGLAALAAAGLAGVEVDHQDHDAATRATLRGVAADLGLVQTGSSDYHGTGKVDHELGCNTTHPDQLDRLLERAERAAAGAGRGTAQVERA